MALRPIAVGETLRRLVSKIAMRSPHVLEAINHLMPTQLGVGVPGAAETIPMALQNWVTSHAGDRGWLAMQVDLTNALNTIESLAILTEITARDPALCDWASFCYNEHSLLFSGGLPIRSEQGVQQGDPLGPLFFSLAWQKVVESLPIDLSLNLWYLDDGHLVGSPSVSKKFTFWPSEMKFLKFSL